MQKQTLKPIDLSKKLLPYENKWVALTPDNKKVVAAGKTIKMVTKKLEKMRNNDALLMFVLPFDKSYAP